MGWSCLKDVTPTDRNRLCLRAKGDHTDDSGVDGRPKDCNINSPKTLNIHITVPFQRSHQKLQ